MRLGAKFQGWWRGGKPRRSLRFTKFGTSVVIVAFGVGFAAMNTGNNLLYMVLGMVLGLILASGLVSEHAIRTAQASWILPGESFAGDPAPLRLSVSNPGRRPLLGLMVTLRVQLPGGENVTLGPARFLIVPPGGQRAKDFTLRPAVRGRLVLQQVTLTTAFPFGFFEKSIRRMLGAEWVVYPALSPLREKAQPADHARREREAPERGAGDSFWGLREFRKGDHPRQVAWKTAAKRGVLVVRETEREADHRVTLSMGAAAEWAALPARDREEAISLGAAFVVRKTAQGFAVGFFGPAIALPPGSDGARRAALRYLALFDPAKAAGEAAAPSDSVDLLTLWKTTR